MKEHSSLAVHPIHRAPDQLKSAAQTALRAALPGQRLGVQCQEDGNVQVSGSVASLEQKLKVSQALRRLHGCTSVTNLTVARAGEAAQQPPPARKAVNTPPLVVDTPEQPTTAAPAPKRGGLFGMFAKTPPKETEPPYFKVTTHTPSVPANLIETKAIQKTPSPAPSGDAYETRGLVVVSSDEPTNAKSAAKSRTAGPPAVTPSASSAPTTAAAPPALSAAQLKKRIEAAVPGVRNLVVIFTSKTDVRIECSTRPGDDSSAIAGQILSVRELSPYKPDLQIQVPDQK